MEQQKDGHTITKEHDAHDRPLTSPLGTSVFLMSAEQQVIIHGLKSNVRRHGDLKREHSSRDQGQSHMSTRHNDENIPLEIRGKLDIHWLN